MLPTDLLPKAQQIIDRLAAIDYENPQICERRIRDAFKKHLIALNQRDRFVEIYHSFFDAVEAGLFCYWVTTTKVIALTLPVMRIEDDRLHADGQPAVQWSDWECYYFWRGLQIPQKYGAVLSKNWRSQ